MQIVIFSTISIFIIILGMGLIKKRAKAHKDGDMRQFDTSLQSDDGLFDDFMCLKLTDGSTIISGKTPNGEKFIARNNTRRSVK